MEIASASGSYRYSGSQRHCDCTAIYREPGTTLFLTWPLSNVYFIWDSCHLHWVHRYRYFSSYPMTVPQTLTSTQLMFVSFAPSLFVMPPVACAISTLHAQRSGQRQAHLLAGLNYGANLSSARVSRQALFSRDARCRYMRFSLCVLMPVHLSSWNMAVFDCALSQTFT